MRFIRSFYRLQIVNDEFYKLRYIFYILFSVIVPSLLVAVPNALLILVAIGWVDSIIMPFWTIYLIGLYIYLGFSWFILGHWITRMNKQHVRKHFKLYIFLTAITINPFFAYLISKISKKAYIVSENELKDVIYP